MQKKNGTITTQTWITEGWNSPALIPTEYIDVSTTKHVTMYVRGVTLYDHEVRVPVSSTTILTQVRHCQGLAITAYTHTVRQRSTCENNRI